MTGSQLYMRNVNDHKLCYVAHSCIHCPQDRMVHSQNYTSDSL